MSYLNVLITFLGLSFVIFFHELGHYLFCRLFGVFVETFSIGFGSSIYSYVDKHNTKWVFGWILLGGYIMPIENSKQKQFSSNGMELKSVELKGMEEISNFKNIIISFAGPFFNFLLGFIILFGVIMYKGQPKMNFEISHVKNGSIAHQHDFREGDSIIAVAHNVDGKVCENMRKAKIVNGSIITLKRRNNVIQKKINLEQGQKFTGLGFKYSYKKVGIIKAFILALKTIFKQIFICIFSFIMVFKLIFFKLFGLNSGVSYVNLSGTVGILQTINNSLKNSLCDFFIIISEISVSLGVFNLFPIPVLDGGNILIKIIESIIGRRLNKKVSEVICYIGFSVLISLFIFATLLDFFRLKG